MSASASGGGGPTVRLLGTARLGMVLMIAALSVPAITGPFADREARSRLEKRALAALPVWSDRLEAPSYFAALGTFLDDHVGLVLDANRLHRKILFYVFRDDPVRRVRVGGDGFVYQTGAIDLLCGEGPGDASGGELAGKIDRVFGWLEARGYRASLAVAVTKPGLYPEHLPLKVPVRIRAACAAYAASPTRPHGLAGIGPSDGRVFHYPFAEFKERRDERAFFPRERFHWKGLSTHVFAKGLLEKMGIPVGAGFGEGARRIEVMADLRLMGFDRYVEAWDFPYSAYGLANRNHSPKVVRDYYQRARAFSTWTSAEPLSDRRALLLSDSFGRELAGHLAPGFTKLVHVNLNHLRLEEWEGFFTALLDQLDITDVVFLSNDGGLAKTHMFDGVSLLDDQATARTPGAYPSRDLQGSDDVRQGARAEPAVRDDSRPGG